MKEIRFETISLAGGPLFAMVERYVPTLGGQVRFGIVLGLGLWLILLLFVVTEGLGELFLSTQIAAVHVRLLVVIPILFFCASVFETGVRNFCAAMVTRKVVSGDDLAALDKAASVLTRLNFSWGPEIAIVAVAVSISTFVPGDMLPGISGQVDANNSPFSGSLAGSWYWFVCLPIFRILVLRWMWRLCLWVWLVWRISRCQLALSGSHPDLAAGLGQFETVQQQLTPLIAAQAAIGAAGLVEQFHGTAVELAAIYFQMAITLMFGIVIVLGPSVLFTWALYRCRLKSEIEFSDVASRYAREFDDRWYRSGQAKESDLLGSADIQSLADIATAYDNIRSIRLVPASHRLIVSIVLSAVIPFFPMALLEFPASEILSALFQRLLG